ncbi:hypothetical protein [Paraliobacillus ryukyuensis]|uniref:hypothetical protein n=1 Tax=Paraliobacillus ryukyuensis TaxID=200904 RepID=UPI000DE81F0F|nr:hypothetical protein [Paraliobacillus ryukyuensis]
MVGFYKEMDAYLAKHHSYIREKGNDLPEVTASEWKTLINNRNRRRPGGKSHQVFFLYNQMLWKEI